LSQAAISQKMERVASASHPGTGGTPGLDHKAPYRKP
jgi:hypothetical protein